jgi:hypothetical protein
MGTVSPTGSHMPRTPLSIRPEHKTKHPVLCSLSLATHSTVDWSPRAAIHTLLVNAKSLLLISSSTATFSIRTP